MSRTKTAVVKKAAITKTPRSAARERSTPSLVLPLGFASIFGLLAYFSLCGLALVAPYLFSNFWPSSYEYWPQAVFLALTAGVCVLLSLEPRPKTKDQRSKIGIFLALFVAWCALSLTGAAYLHDAILEFARVAGVVAWFYIARTLLQDAGYFARRALWLLIFIAAGAVLVCMPAILDFLITRNPRQFATFYNPNLFANYCAMALPLAAAGVLALWRGDGSFSNNLRTGASVVAFLVIAAGLVVTSSKGGWLAALCGLMVFALAVLRAQGENARRVLRARRGIVVIVSLVVLLGGGVLFSQMILPRLSSRLSEDHSTMFRVYTWRGTARMAAAKPLLGHGIGSFPSAYTRFAETGYTRTSHQLWLQLAAESGFPAMLLLLLACGMSTHAGWRALQSENWMFAAGGLGALAAFFIHGLTDAGWSIISIATLAMGVLALLERSAVSGQRSANSSLVTRHSSLNWFWLLAALPLALGSWLTQRAQQGEDLRRESREMMARGMPRTAVEKASEAVDSDPKSARLLMNLAQAKEATGRRGIEIWDEIIKSQPTRALNFLNYAEYLTRNTGDAKRQPKAFFNGAIRLDPNDTEIRLSRGQWKLANNDQSGWQDIEYIAALKDKPYGKYPATPEMVDLNFARAYAMLAQRDISKNQKTAKNWIARGLEVIAEARKYEPPRRAMEQATQGQIDYSREQTMNELEAQFKVLQGKLK